MADESFDPIVEHIHERIDEEYDKDKQQQPQSSGLMSLGSLVLLLGLVLVVVVVGMQLVNQNRGQPTNGPAPDFAVTTFDGELFSLAEQRGSVVVLNFWGSWCGPCRAEAPSLEAIYDEYRDQGVVFIGITYLDEDADSLQFIEEYDITYPNAPDSQLTVADDYRIDGAPETFVINQDGEIVRFFYGPIYEGSIHPDQLTDLLDELLATTES